MKQHKEFISSIRKVEESVKLSTDLGKSNSTKIPQNTDRIENNTFEVDELKEKLNTLIKDYNKLGKKLDNNRNRSLRKTIIFKNIPVQIILAKEIHTLMPNLELEYIQSKTERGHHTKDNKYINVPPIIAKFNDWQFTEMIKASIYH